MDLTIDREGAKVIVVKSVTLTLDMWFQLACFYGVHFHALYPW